MRFTRSIAKAVFGTVTVSTPASGAFDPGQLVAILFRLGSFVSRISYTQNQSDNEQPQNDEEQSIYHSFEPFNPCL